MNIAPLLEQIQTKDPQERIQGLNALTQSMLDIALDDIPSVMDTIRPSLKDNNYKVCEAALTFLCTFLEHIDAKIFQPFFSDFLNLLVERFGDAKNSVRDKAFEAVIMVTKHYSPKEILDAIREGFIHKSWKVREGICLIFIQILQAFGPKNIMFMKYLPDIVSLLDDSTQSVRDAAVMAICEIYRYVGVDLLQELGNYKLRTPQLKAIEDRASEIMVDTENLVPLKPKTLKSPVKNKSARHTIHTIGATAGRPSSVATNEGDGEENDVQPVYIKESDLSREMEVSIEILEDMKNVDWKRRLNCIRRLRGLVHGGATDFPGFIAEFSRIRESLSKNLLDLRSTIVKESCMLLNLLAKTMGSRFESLSDYFVPIILKSTVVTVQVISDSVNVCIRTLITHAKLNRSIIVIVEKLIDPKSHATMRARCAEYLVLMLQHVDSAILTKNIDDISKAVKSAINDASAGARQAGRQAYFALKDTFPDKAYKLYTELDPNTQKKLNTSDDTRSGQISPRSTTSSVVSGTSVSSYVSSASTLRRTKSVITRKISKTDSIVVQEPKNHTKPTIPTLPLSGTYPPSPKKPPSLQVKAMTRTPTSPSSPLSPRGSSSSQKSPSASVRLSKSFEVGPLDKSSNDPMDTSLDSPTMESVNSILRDTKNMDWKSKVQVLEKLETIIDSDRISEVKSTFLQVINLYIDRLSDTHLKVVEKTLTSSLMLIDKLPDCVEPYLERILSKLFLLLTEEKTKLLSEQLLTKIASSYSGDILLPRIFKIVDTYHSRVRVACLEFLMHIVQGSSAYLSYPGHMRSSIKKIIALIQVNTSKPCEAALTSIMISLYSIHPHIFLEQMLSLPSLEQNPIKNLLRERIPDFEHTLTIVSKKSSQPSSNVSSPLSAKSPNTNIKVVENTIPSRIEKYKISTAQELKNERESLDELSACLTAIAKYKIDNNPHQVYRCLFDITEIARQKPPSESVWQISFAKLIFYLFDLFFDEDEIVREKALLSVAALLRYQNEHCIKFADITFRKLMEKFNDKVPAVQRTAERVAEQFIESMDPQKTLELIKPQIINNSEKEQQLLGGLRIMTKLIKQISPEILLTHVPSILPGVYEAFKHSNVDIRKSVVYLMVDLHFALGESFDPYLKRLSVEQQKLIQIYIKKSEVK
ncbi:hypothetical protein C9374_002226 [Naegleria lovaniensis]|uniref:TOG domain-containing protein n=1 Tax=Naegleria lovaniensis TaxID=51637 RepID=A0AA88GPH8_NAELO|nr:uncharacterized protein C9374_002226 [Naegleria lovaniensis]KAG2386482.1 hypothetical protein C9374_002226 [Naegleria lovaniensis]